MLGVYESDLVGADNEHDAVHVGLRAHFLLHLPEPAIESVETLPEADVINQQHPLTVLIELITHLTGRNNKKHEGREKGSRWRWRKKKIIFLVKQHHLLVDLIDATDANLTSDMILHVIFFFF